ncbi:MAG TPA: alkaline phosphatase family protein, partial [Anaerolineae bacterium]|nr:alkaline phosphatase family protein [Anaerolineae bacterium]
CLCGLLFFAGAEILAPGVAVGAWPRPADPLPTGSNVPTMIPSPTATLSTPTRSPQPVPPTPPSLVPTDTPQPPTATSTRVVPLNTPTPLPPTATSTPLPTNTPIPSPTPGCRPLGDEEGLANLIIVIWDGTQRAHLQEMLGNSQLPNLRALAQRSGGLVLPVIRSSTCQPGSGDGYRTETGPANSAIATGLGYPGMANWQNIEPYPIPNNFTLWEWFYTRPYATGIVSSKDMDFWPHSPLRNSRPEIDYWKVGEYTQAWVTDGALEFLEGYAECHFFLWLHYKEPDTVGHEFGENSAQYSASLEVNDQELARLLDGLRAHGIEGRTLVIVTTDHGFNEGGLNHDVCAPETKDLFLAMNQRMPALRGCIKVQTDLAPCIKAAVPW